MASRDLAAAIATLLKDDQERILSLASSLRGPDRSIESTVVGTSMGSGLPPGSRIRIEMSTRGDWPLGEVVAFVGGHQVIVHRLVHNGGDYVLTRGDARVAPDAPVRREQILGPVTAVARNGEWEKLAPPAVRRPLARACARLILLAARTLLHFGPGITGTAMRFLHALEARAHLALGRRISISR